MFWIGAGAGMPMGDLVFEDVRVMSGDATLYLAIVKSHVSIQGASPGELGAPGRKRVKVPCGGSVTNVLFRNVSVTGKASYLVGIEGRSESEDVKDVRFENVTVNGRRIAKESPEVDIGKHADGISFR